MPVAKMDTTEPQDLLDLKEKLDHQATLSHPRSLDLLAHLATTAKTELLALQAAQAQLDPSDLLDLKDSLANQEQLVIQVTLALKVQRL